METIKQYAILAWTAIKAKPTVFAYGVVAGYFISKIL